MLAKKGTAVAVCIMAALIVIGGYAAYRLYSAHQAYAEGDQAYAEILQQVVSQPDDEQNEQEKNVRLVQESEQAETESDTIEVPERTVDFAALSEINSDAVGWLYCPGTVIDYPVMAGTDYTAYLYHLPDGTYNINGSLFTDFNDAPDFSGALTVIYGHNMKSGSMFGTLTQYKAQSYYDEHPYLYLYTPTQNYRIALLYGALIPAQQWSDEGYAVDADIILSYAAANTTFTSSETYTPGQQLIALSTCSYEYSDARYFVLGILQST
jgi:sortase B